MMEMEDGRKNIEMSFPLPHILATPDFKQHFRVHFRSEERRVGKECRN